MKKALITLLTLCLTIIQFVYSQVQVQDKNTRYQVEREVITRWGKFKPKWYYILLHNKYRKGEDRRNILQLYPTMLYLEKNRIKAENQLENTTEVSEYKIAEQANIIAEKHYHLHFKAIFDRLTKRYNTLLFQGYDLGVSTLDRQQFIDEKLMLDNYLEAVRSENIEPGESQEAMTQIQKDYETLIAVMHKTNNLYKTKNKFTTIDIE
ncbi:MAG: hypothetical protein CMO01_04105 [Thalassobius sp.]|nr:hypothetical protein [Thalassovita sp.]|tara:strand:- start:45 stop:668 length:624 start_codon:yes stop_codon:yes gene_type:complete